MVQGILVVSGCGQNKKTIRIASIGRKTFKHVGDQCVHVSRDQSIELGIGIPQYKLEIRRSVVDSSGGKAS